jgi:hypothetical protein
MKTLKIIVDENTFNSYSLSSEDAISFSELEEKVLLKHQNEIITLSEPQKNAIKFAQEQVKNGKMRTNDEVFTKVDSSGLSITKASHIPSN